MNPSYLTGFIFDFKESRSLNLGVEILKSWALIYLKSGGRLRPIRFDKENDFHVNKFAERVKLVQ